MIRRLAAAVVPLTFAAALVGTVAACHRQRAAEAPPPAPAPPPPPPPPCDVIGSWQALPPLPLGPQQIDILPSDKPGVYNVRAHNGNQMGVATIQTSTGTMVDTNITNPIFRCTVGADCNTMTCALTGGAAPTTWKRMP